MGWFTNNKDPDNILKEASSLVDKFKDIQKRAVAEIAEWETRKAKALTTKNSAIKTANAIRDRAIDSAHGTYETKATEVAVAKDKLEQASTLSGKILSLFED